MTEQKANELLRQSLLLCDPPLISLVRDSVFERFREELNIPVGRVDVDECTITPGTDCPFAFLLTLTAIYRNNGTVHNDYTQWIKIGEYDDPKLFERLCWF